MKIATQRRNRFAGCTPSSSLCLPSLHGVDTKGEQNGTKEDSHDNAVETMLSWKIFSQPGSLRSSRFPLFCQGTVRLYKQSMMRMLLVTNGETTAVGDFLCRLVIMLEVMPQ